MLAVLHGVPHSILKKEGERKSESESEKERKNALPSNFWIVFLHNNPQDERGLVCPPGAAMRMSPVWLLELELNLNLNLNSSRCLGHVVGRVTRNLKMEIISMGGGAYISRI